MPGSLDLPEKLKETSAAGYDYLELSIDETDEKLSRLDWSPAYIIALRHAMETPFINTVTKAAAWVRKCRSQFLQIYPDSGNITNAALENGGEIKEDIKKGAGNLVAFHLKESKPDIYREVPYGQGHVNFSEVIQTVWRLGVRLFVAEFWHSDTVDSWRDTLRENNRFLRKFLDEADCS